MNYVKTYLIVKAAATNSSVLNQGRYAWLPIDNTPFLIIFNVSHLGLQLLLKNKVVPSDSFFSDSATPQPGMPVSEDTFRVACNSFNQRIDLARSQNAKYKENFDRLLRDSTSGKITSGHQLWVLCCLLYGGLFNK